MSVSYHCFRPWSVRLPFRQICRSANSFFYHGGVSHTVENTCTRQDASPLWRRGVSFARAGSATIASKR